MSFFVYGNDGMADALVGPFRTRETAQLHRRFLQAQGEPASMSRVLTARAAKRLEQREGGIELYTAKLDRQSYHDMRRQGLLPVSHDGPALRSSASSKH